MNRFKVKKTGELTCRMDLSKLARKPPGVRRGPEWLLVGEAGGVCTSTDRTSGEAPCRTSAKQLFHVLPPRKYSHNFGPDNCYPLLLASLFSVRPHKFVKKLRTCSAN